MAGTELREMNEDDARALVDFIRDTVNRAGCKGAVVGLSGGIDSATITKLCIEALGAKNVINIFMPTSVTPLNDYKSTKVLSSRWGTTYKVVDIQPAVDAFTAALFTDQGSQLERGNISARCRMIVLYNIARKKNYLVVGTSNRSELMMGYFTKFGDGAADVAPMIDLYKTQVWQLAKLLAVPQVFIDKIPTAGLWEGQTDEGEMGITYHDLDLVLNGIALSMTDEDISKDTGVSVFKVMETRDRISAMEHKRVSAYCPDKRFNA